MKKKKVLALTTVVMFSALMIGCEDYDEKQSLLDKEEFYSDAEEENEEDDDIIPDMYEEDKMEIYNIAVQLYDTWITGRMEENQAKAESVLYPDEEMRFGDDYSPINGYNDYELIQFLVTDTTEDALDYGDEFPQGMNLEMAYQLDSQLQIYKPDGSSEWDTCADSIFKIDGKWYLFPDVSVCDIEPEKIGFSIPGIEATYDYGPLSGNYTDEWVDYYVLPDGSKISEEEYEASKIKKNGYNVEKKADGSFSFHPIGEDGMVVFDDGSIAIVNGAHWAD